MTFLIDERSPKCAEHPEFIKVQILNLSAKLHKLKAKTNYAFIIVLLLHLMVFMVGVSVAYMAASLIVSQEKVQSAAI